MSARRLLLATVLLLGAITLRGAQAISTFAALPQGDTLRITLEEDTCTEYLRWEFTFDNRGHGSFVVDELRVPAWPTIPSGRSNLERKRLGTISLEAGERAQLDAYLASFSNPNNLTLSLGQTTVILTQIRRGKPVAEQRYRNPVSTPAPGERVLSFPEMIAALRSSRGS